MQKPIKMHEKKTAHERLMRRRLGEQAAYLLEGDQSQVKHFPYD